MNRAYALLNIKSVDTEKRTFSGVATTPTPDRVGDIVEPLGVGFTNPLPLLLYHDSRQPVGTVMFQRPTADGIEFTASIPTIDSPPTLKDRVDTAWSSVKAGLLAGVSIGFRAIEEAYNKETNGFRFLKTEVLELSLVAVPANQDCTIATIKSLDLAASGRHTPGVSGIPLLAGRKDARSMKKTTAEKMAEFKATKDAKIARMNELSNADDGATLDNAQQEEFDTLLREVKSIDGDLARFDALEQINKASAVTVNGGSPAQASASRGGSVITVKDQLPPGIKFARYAACLAAAQGSRSEALDIAKERYPDDQDIHMVLKAAISAGTTTDATWAEPLVNYQNFMGDFVEFLRPKTIIGQFGTNGIPSLRRVPFNIRVTGQTTGGNGYWVGEGQAKPVTKFDFTGVTLRWAKVANIAVLTEELVRFSNPSAEALVRDALAGALIERLDRDFVDPLKAEVVDVSPASITNGVVAINSTGTDAASVRADVKLIFAPFIAANIDPTDAVWIMSPSNALKLSLMANALGQPEFPGITMKGGTFMGLPVIVSSYVQQTGSPTLDIVVLVNASDIYLSDDGQVVIDISREASLQMDSAPTNASGDTSSPSAPVPTTLVSLWQTNSIGLRAERFINWKRRRPASVQFLYDVHWA